MSKIKKISIIYCLANTWYLMSQSMCKRAIYSPLLLFISTLLIRAYTSTCYGTTSTNARSMLNPTLMSNLKCMSIEHAHNIGWNYNGWAFWGSWHKCYVYTGNAPSIHLISPLSIPTPPPSPTQPLRLWRTCSVQPRCRNTNFKTHVHITSPNNGG